MFTKQFLPQWCQFFLFSEKYRDLIDAADTISTMATIVGDITGVTDNILKTEQINNNTALDRLVGRVLNIFKLMTFILFLFI